MLPLHSISLKPYNTFGIDLPASSFIPVFYKEEIPECMKADVLKGPVRILGGGSNLLLKKPVDGTVLHNRIKGISIEKENAEHIWIRVNSGEVWHDFVGFAVSRDYGGIENLSLIPGTVGGAPVQNIGAYGVSVEDVIEAVEIWHWKERCFLSLEKSSCHFGYRDSIFKQSLKGHCFITSVLFRLDKRPRLNTAYGTIEKELTLSGIVHPTVRDVANAVIRIRRSKLPDPAEIGNAGSFFKNPVLPADRFRALQSSYPEMPFYPAGEELVKIPAGWLIEKAGWKGFRRNDAGVHAKQALVLVNYGQASGEDIWQLSEDIVLSVQEITGITLEREVQVWP